MVRGSGGLGGRVTVAAAAVLVALLVFVANQAGAADPPPTVSVSDVTVNEGNDAGSTKATVTIKLSAVATVDTVVNYTTADGSAKAPDDYTATSGTTTIPTGKDSVTVDVPIVSNTTPQDDRAFTFTISLPDPGSNPPAATLGTATANITIVDDDWQVKITPKPSDAKAAENGGTIDFAVGLSNDAAAPATHKISVDYKVANDSAVLGTDYKLTDGIDAQGTLTFAPGETVKHIKVTGLDDGVYGPNKKFTVTLSNPKGASLASGAEAPQTGTITEVTSPPLLAINDCTGGVVKAGTDAQFLVRMSAQSQLPTTFKYTTVDVSTGDLDFDHVTAGDFTIAPGQTSANVVVSTKVNPPDGDRSFRVDLSNLSGATLLTPTSGSASCTIRNSGSGGGGGGGGSTLGSVSITGPDAAVTEPAAGSPGVPVTFTVTYSAPASQPPQAQPVTVQWTTQDGTATSPSDYTAANGTLTWPAGTVGAKTVTVTVNPAGATPDTTPEAFSVKITATNANVTGTGTAQATILPRNSTTSVLSAADASDLENAGTIPVKITLAPAATTPVTVHYATEDGTATAGTDYTATSGDLTFAPGEVSKTVPVTIIDNSTPERDKMFDLRLSTPSGATIGRAVATVTIVNDDALPPAVPRANPLTKPIQAPVPVPTQQPVQTNGPATHLVLPGILNGESKVDAKGHASFRVSCPSVVVKRCKGTIALEVRVAQKATKSSKAKLKTIRVGNGAFTIPVGKIAAVPVQLTKPGFAVVKSLHRIKVKATLRAVDGSGTKGVTAWLVSLVAPKQSSQISVSVK